MSARGLLRHLAVCATLLVACTEGPTGPDVGALNIRVLGLPAGAAAAVTVAGPEGFLENVTSNAVFDAVPSGDYIVTAITTTFQEDIFTAAVAVDTVRVLRSRQAEASVSYTLASGTIAFVTLGVPEGSTGEARLQGPGGASRNITIPGVARGLLAGPWQLSFPRLIGADGHGYDAATPETIIVAASPFTVPRLVAYAIGTGAIDATFSGLPSGVAPRAVLSGPLGIVATLEASGPRVGLEPGQYTIAPQAVFVGDVRYAASNVTQTVTAGFVPSAFSVTYTPRTGRLTLAATGLPAAVIATARVTHTSGLDSTIAIGDTLRGLAPGTYTVEGARIAVGSELYTSGAPLLVSVAGGQTTVATLAYASSGSFDLKLEAAYAVQTVQRRDGTVPLVANRSALIRVFATATGPNALSVPVRVRIVNGGAIAFDQLVAASTTGVPYVVDESTFDGSWRVQVPAAAVQPGAQLQVTLDPSETAPEANRSNNTSTVALDVRTLPTFRARFVPIRFAAGGGAGNVTASNAAAFLQLTRDMMPVADVDIDLRSEYVTNQPRLTSSNGDVWEDVLAELNTLRVLEASRRFYMGIIPVGYTSGIAGIAYLGAPTSLTWDYLPSGSEVLAHELGHNFNRRHAPCGGPSGVDASYPHADAELGAFGWDARLSRIRAPRDKDIMSYCDDPWVSDYTWAGVTAFRGSAEPLAVAAASEQQVLLVRGRITPGGVQLEPTFTLAAVPALPQPGSHRLEIRDANGALLYGASFRAVPVPHAKAEGTEHFTFAIPTAALGGRSPATLSVRSGTNQSELRGSDYPSATQPALRVAPGIGAVRRSDGSLRILDADPATRGMIVRDAATGRIISIVRGRDVTLPAGLGELDVLSSDGLRSRTLRIKPPTR